jgi:pyruvate-formate lyase-activating enzyme
MLDSYNEVFTHKNCISRCKYCKNLETALLEPNVKESGVKHEELY